MASACVCRARVCVLCVCVCLFTSQVHSQEGSMQVWWTVRLGRKVSPNPLLFLCSTTGGSRGQLEPWRFVQGNKEVKLPGYGNVLVVMHAPINVSEVRRWLFKTILINPAGIVETPSSSLAFL